MLSDLMIKRKKLIQEKIYMEKKIKEINMELKETDSLLNKLCSHNRIIDYVDKPYGEGSFQIKYCKYCELIK